jgi:hypothetical protein
MSMNRRRYLATLGASAGALALAGCSESSSDDPGGSDGGGDDVGDDGGDDEQYPNAWAYDSNTGILIENAPDNELNQIGALYIRGTAVNESDDDYDYVQLTFDIFDSSGAKIDDGLANTSGLDAGQTWRFEALAPSSENADSYELADITAY